jgi:hypothetical protein
MVFFLGEKMMVTGGSGEGKQQAERAELPNPNVQINAAGIGLLVWGFSGEEQALWTAVETLADNARVNILIIGSMHGI